MSWFLNYKKYIFLLIFGAMALVCLLLQWYIIAFIVFLILLLFFIGSRLVKQCLNPLSDLTASRPIRTIDTLIIGDLCPQSGLKLRFDLNKALLITAPGRSVEVSFLILQHVASRLDGKNVCIVAPHNNSNNKPGVLDLPFLSGLTKLEMNLKENPIERSFYCFFHPLAAVSLMFLWLSRPRLEECNNQEIVAYCERKGFQLTFLRK